MEARPVDADPNRRRVHDFQHSTGDGFPSPELGGFYNALAPVALTDSATVTPDFGAGLDFTLTKSQNGSLANPTNAKVGQRGTITVTQDGTGGRTMSYGSAWKRRGGAPALSTGAGKIDELVYEVKAQSGGVATRIVYDLLKDAT